MILSFLRVLILGIGSAVIALFTQLLLTPYPKSDTLLILLFLTGIEETVRFSILFISEKKNILPSYPFFASISFSIGFTFVETIFSSNISPLHIIILFVIHTALTAIILFGIRSKKTVLSLLVFLLVVILHISYNTLVWFARF